MGMNKEHYTKRRIKLMRDLSELAQQKGISNSELAKKTGFDIANIYRMFSGKYSPGIDNIMMLADAIGYDVAFENKMLNETIPEEHIDPKFMFSIDPVNSELYILHRRFPSCLIQLKQETPARFIILDLYDEVPNPADILNMPFVEEAKEFYRNYAQNLFADN